MRSKLLGMLKAQFSDSELRDICFELDIDYENLPGASKGDKARELVLFLERRGRILELLETCQRLRPQVSWPLPAGDVPLDLIQAAKTARTKILFLAANPSDTNQLSLDDEIRAIDQAVRQAEFRDQFDLEQHWAVGVADLQSYLLRHQPDIVHFSSHGSEASEVILEDYYGDSHPVSPEALGKLFSLFRDNIRCIVLNACYSERQAQVLADHIDCVIGMSKTIGDTAAISFAAAFYQALGYGKDVETAFNLGCVQIDMENLDEQDTPKLLATKINPKSVVFSQYG